MIFLSQNHNYSKWIVQGMFSCFIFNIEGRTEPILTKSVFIYQNILLQYELRKENGKQSSQARIFIYNKYLYFRMRAEALDAHSKLLEIQSRLTKFAYLSKEPLPGAADALVFQKLKNSQKMPSKQRYFNFYHWYITMSQFAQKEIQKWVKDKESLDEDKLIIESIALIESLKAAPLKKADPFIDYVMNIFLKEPVESNLMVTKNKLLTLNPEQIGEELKISFKNYQQRVNQYSQNQNELRIMFKLRSTACEKLKDIISKWPQVKNIQIKKQMKQKKL